MNLDEKFQLEQATNERLLIFASEITKLKPIEATRFCSLLTSAINITEICSMENFDLKIEIGGIRFSRSLKHE